MNAPLQLSPHLAISIAQACEICGLGRTFLYGEIKKRSLASIKIGARRLIRVAELERWLAEHEDAL